MTKGKNGSSDMIGPYRIVSIEDKFPKWMYKNTNPISGKTNLVAEVENDVDVALERYRNNDIFAALLTVLFRELPNYDGNQIEKSLKDAFNRQQRINNIEHRYEKVLEEYHNG